MERKFPGIRWKWLVKQYYVHFSIPYYFVCEYPIKLFHIRWLCCGFAAKNLSAFVYVLFTNRNEN